MIPDYIFKWKWCLLCPVHVVSIACSCLPATYTNGYAVDSTDDDDDDDSDEDEEEDYNAYLTKLHMRLGWWDVWSQTVCVWIWGAELWI